MESNYDMFSVQFRQGECNVISKHRVEPLIALTQPQSPITESYRTIRTNLQFASIDTETKIILVTSSGPSEGKTSTTCNLAIVSAQAGKRVLVIDADLRKPQVHLRFQVSNLTGLSTVLTRERGLEESIIAARIENLFLMPSGPIPPNPSEMLSSKGFRELLNRCTEEYDLVIVDTPPILAVSDALIVSQSVDGALLVVDAQGTNRKAAMQAKLALEQVNARLLGVILNRVKKNRGEGYYYNYSYSSATTAKM